MLRSAFRARFQRRDSVTNLVAPFPGFFLYFRLKHRGGRYHVSLAGACGPDYYNIKELCCSISISAMIRERSRTGADLTSKVPQMPKKLRLRRVVILCREFARNLAYVRAGQREEYSHLVAESNPTASFWRVIRNNALDMCVLEWCKLFGDKQARHYWGKVVSNPAEFEEHF